VERAALVTGGTSGIGLAIARVLREEGFALTLAANRAEELERAAAELGAQAVHAELEREEDCRRCVTEHERRFGRLDVLVNSAGIAIPERFEETPLEHVDRTLAINLRAVVLVTQAALPLLRSSHGLIVSLASLAALEPSPRFPIYAATKAGVVSLTRSINADAAADGVRACAIAPGIVDTPMTQGGGLDPDQLLRPEDCAEVVRLLLRLSPRARIPLVELERTAARG
jgi:NAD(P)-dependent dehydrogenase (short-subunit alcohol dehydrogenase family)